MYFSNNLYYLIVISSISFWWLLAFQNPIAHEMTCSFKSEEEQISISSEIDFLNLNRDEIQSALEGDVVKMKSLILEWEIAAEHLECKGVGNIKRLEREEFIFSQLIGPKLINDQKLKKTIIIDQLGQPIDISASCERIFPQTYHSGEILLALTEAKKIVALNEGLKNQKFLRNSQKINEITTFVNCFDGEKIFLAKPQVAIVAEYSHPSLIQILKKQGVQLFFQKQIENLEDLHISITNLGFLCNESLKSKLLNIFIKSALNAIDNKRQIYLKNFNYDKVLVLQYYSKHSLPAENSFINYFIQRMDLHKNISSQARSDNTRTPFSEDQIIKINPDYLIIITEMNDDKSSYFYKKRYCSHINAGKKKQIFLLDEEIQQTTSQYAVLAYFDLNNCLINLNAF